MEELMCYTITEQVTLFVLILIVILIALIIGYIIGRRSRKKKGRRKLKNKYELSQFLCKELHGISPKTIYDALVKFENQKQKEGK